MLENDLVLARFLDQSAASLDADAAACLYRLLDLSDNDLWGLISGREEPPDAALAPMVRALRAA